MTLSGKAHAVETHHKCNGELSERLQSCLARLAADRLPSRLHGCAAERPSIRCNACLTELQFVRQHRRCAPLMSRMLYVVTAAWSAHLFRSEELLLRGHA